MVGAAGISTGMVTISCTLLLSQPDGVVHVIVILPPHAVTSLVITP